MSSPEKMVESYLSGMSIPQIASLYSTPRSTVRFRLKKAGVLRTRNDALALASKQGRLGLWMKGRKRKFTLAWCKNISAAKIAAADKTAAGVSLKPDGYIEYTRGEHKGRGVHVVIMEKRMGRRLLADECVHHIDGNKENNKENNLALMTCSAHARLHRFEDMLAGKERDRKTNGRFG